MLKVVRKKMDLASKAPGGLERSDSICSDVQLQIFAEGKRGEGWEGSTHPTVWVQVLI